jgi:hypothetical protein
MCCKIGCALTVEFGYIILYPINNSIRTLFFSYLTPGFKAGWALSREIGYLGDIVNGRRSSSLIFEKAMNYPTKEKAPRHCIV